MYHMGRESPETFGAVNADHTWGAVASGFMKIMAPTIIRKSLCSSVLSSFAFRVLTMDTDTFFPDVLFYIRNSMRVSSVLYYE